MICLDALPWHTYCLCISLYVGYLFVPCYCLCVGRIWRRGSGTVRRWFLLPEVPTRQDVFSTSLCIYLDLCFPLKYFATIILHSIPMSFGNIRVSYHMHKFLKPLPVSHLLSIGLCEWPEFIIYAIYLCLAMLSFCLLPLDMVIDVWKMMVLRSIAEIL